MKPQRRREASADARLEAALRERDEALLELARVKAELEALKLGLVSSGEAEPKVYPAAVTPGDPPLRYVVVDGLHGAVKNVLGVLKKPLERRRSPGRR